MLKRAFCAILISLAVPAFAARLPENVVPRHYRIKLAPDIAAEKFSGDETIDVDVREAARSITLNAAEIEFDDVTITNAGRTQKAQVALDPKNESATLTFAEPVVGSASLDIRFRGILNDKLRGFYISRTPRRKYAVTQLEATDARRAFPSFDEPALKATFDISTVIDQGDIAISNSPVVSDTPGPGGKHTVTFARTKPLPTYLVALLAGDFKCSEGASDGIPIRICTTPDKVDLTHYAVDAAAKELHYLNGYYGIKYPFEKLDVIGIPDFAAGAMENAAAMTFRESALLVDDRRGSNTQRERVASVIAHELAHQWFGDLVTMRWWDDIWLNEGFASWMGGKATAALNPQWDTAADAAEATSRSLTSDSLASTRAIRTHAETPAQIDALFDQIAYGKTSAVLRMAESYVGPDLFRRGINAYLSKFSYANASAEDFWGTMAEATQQPLDRIFSSFVLQPGAPLVTAAAQCDGDNTLLTLTQRRFFSDRAESAAGSDHLWAIPVVARSLERDGRTYRVLLDEASHTFSLPGCTSHLFINADGRGYYRSSYSPSLLGSNTQLREKLTTAEKVSLLADEWALVRAGEKSVAEYLARVETLIDAGDPALVSAIVPSLTSAGETLTTPETRSAYRAWLRRLLAPAAAKAGWMPVASESDDAKRMRTSVLMALADTAKDPQVQRRARELAPAVLKGTSVADAEFAENVLNIAARSGDASLYDALLAKALQAKTPEQDRMYLNALQKFASPALVRRSLQFVMSPQVRSQDRSLFIAAILTNAEARPTAWPWVKEHWAEIEKVIPPFTAGRIPAALSRACTAADRDDLKAFYAAHPTATSERSARASVERVSSCVAFHQQQAGSLAAFLKGHQREAAK